MNYDALYCAVRRFPERPYANSTKISGLALACAQQRERDAAGHGNATLVGLWEIIAFYILCLRASSLVEPAEYLADMFKYFQ